MSSEPTGTSRKMITSSVVLLEEQRELLVDVAAARTAKSGRRFSMSDVIRELVEGARSSFEAERRPSTIVVELTKDRAIKRKRVGCKRTLNIVSAS